LRSFVGGTCPSDRCAEGLIVSNDTCVVPCGGDHQLACADGCHHGLGELGGACTRCGGIGQRACDHGCYGGGVPVVFAGINYCVSRPECLQYIEEEIGETAKIFDLYSTCPNMDRSWYNELSTGQDFESAAKLCVSKTDQQLENEHQDRQTYLRYCLWSGQGGGRPGGGGGQRCCYRCIGGGGGGVPPGGVPGAPPGPTPCTPQYTCGPACN
jgi:hypothetical protein